MSLLKKNTAIHNMTPSVTRYKNYAPKLRTLLTKNNRMANGISTAID